MKINKLITAKESILPLCQERVSPRLAYKMMKFLSALEVEEAFYDAKMKEIIEAYGERNDKGEFVFSGDGVKIARDKIDECNAALSELLNTDVDAPQIVFTLDELNELRMSVKDVRAISDFIQE